VIHVTWASFSRFLLDHRRSAWSLKEDLIRQQCNPLRFSDFWNFKFILHPDRILSNLIRLHHPKYAIKILGVTTAVQSEFTCMWSKRASRPLSVTAQQRNDNERTYRCANGKPRVNSAMSSSVAFRRTSESRPLLTKEVYSRLRELGCMARASQHGTTSINPFQRRGLAYRMSLHLVQTCVRMRSWLRMKLESGSRDKDGCACRACRCANERIRNRRVISRRSRRSLKTSSRSQADSMSLSSREWVSRLLWSQFQMSVNKKK